MGCVCHLYDHDLLEDLSFRANPGFLGGAFLHKKDPYGPDGI